MLILNYLAFGGTFTCQFNLGLSSNDIGEAFTSLRVYGVWGRDWKPLLAVVPLTLIKPALIIVSKPFMCVQPGRYADAGSQYETMHYTPKQGGVPFGCFYDYSLSDAKLAE